MTAAVQQKQVARHGIEEEGELARRAVAGDRGAFDQLFECYFGRLSWHFRALERGPFEEAIARTLEEIFSRLDDAEQAPLAHRVLAAAQAASRSEGR